MQIAGQPSCARFRARETEAHEVGDSGPRLAVSISSGCREVVSFKWLGACPSLSPRPPATAGLLHPGTPRPSYALGRCVCMEGAWGGDSRAIRPHVVHLPTTRAAAPATSTVTRAHLAPGQPRACPPAARSSVPAHVAAAPHARTSPRPARPCPQRRCVSRPRVTHRLPALRQPGPGPSAAPAALAPAAAP